MATRLRQPGLAGSTDQGDNLFNPRQMNAMTFQAPGGNTGVAGGKDRGGVQGPQAGPPAPNAGIQTPPAPPQLPQVPIVAPPLQSNSQQGGNVADLGFNPNGNMPGKTLGPESMPDVQRRAYNTDGYAQPNKVAAGGAPVLQGWDATKWNDPNHQTPKYVSGRFAAEAGNLADPANRQKYLDNMRDAYGEENFRFNGKDKISIDGGKSFVDVFGGASAGIFSPAWQDESSQGGPQNEQITLGMGAATPKPVLRTPAGTSSDPFTSAGSPGAGSGAGDFTQLPNGDWVPKDHPAAGRPSNPVPSGGPVPGGDPSGGNPDVNPRTPGGSPAPGPNGQPGDPQDGSIGSVLKKFLSGDMNKDIVNRRVDSARDVLNKQRSSAVDTLGASLADRGLNAGAAESGAVRLDQGLNDEFAMEVNDIFANEAENADNRLLEALGIGGAMETADKDREVDRYNAETGRIKSDRDYDLGNKDIDVRRRSVDNEYDLGNKRIGVDNRRIDVDERLGNRRIDVDERLGGRGLDLTERGQNIDWDKFSAQFGLDSEDLQRRIKEGDTNALLDLLRIMGGNAGTASGGFI